MQKLWVGRQLQAIDAGGVLAMENTAIFDRVIALAKQLSDTPAFDAAIGMYKVLTSVTGFFTGAPDAPKILLVDETLVKIHNFTDECERERFIRHLVHSKPNLRILEIGG